MTPGCNGGMPCGLVIAGGATAAEGSRTDLAGPVTEKSHEP